MKGLIDMCSVTVVLMYEKRDEASQAKPLFSVIDGDTPVYKACS